MVSFWWGKSSATFLSLKTSALKLFTEADLLYQLSLLNQIIWTVESYMFVKMA